VSAVALADRFGHPLRVVLLDDDAAYADELARRLHRSPNLHLLGTAVHERELPALVADLVPDLLFIDYGLPHGASLDVVARTVKRFPAIPLLLVADEPTGAIWREAVARGARTVMRKDLAEAEMAAVVGEVLETEARHLSRIGPDGAEPGPAGRQAPPPAAAPQLVAVFSPKGGVGKSTIATNLAVWLQGNPFQRVATALVDLEKGLGTTHALLGLPARPHLLDWLDFADEGVVDPLVVRAHTAEHPPTGLRCLFSAGPYAAEPAAGPDLARTVLQSLRLTHAVTVADCAPDLTPAVATALALASTVLLVVEVTAPTMGKVQQAVADLERAGVGLEKFRLVLNRVPAHPDWSPGQIQEALPFPIVARIREDAQAARAANRMRVLAQCAPAGPFMLGVRQIADRLVPGTGHALVDRLRRGPWPRWARAGVRP
jgi:pilus assembly protein CpaE